MQPRTHLGIDPELVGRPTDLSPGHAVVECTASARMAADDRGLVHGGFVFGLADYAAMLAVNHPNVVLGASEVTFSKPVSVGEHLRASASVESESGKKRVIRASVARGDEVVLKGVFTCFVLERHVLDQP